MTHTLADSFALAAVVVGRVLQGDSLTKAMSQVRVTGALRAGVQDLAYSALRDFGCADALLEKLTSRPPAASLRGLLLAALVELQRGPQADHAVVHQAVEAAGRVAPRGGAGAKGMVNAVLRNFLRQREALLAAVMSTDTARYRHPQWWIAQLRAAWPQDWERVLATGNEPPAMTLRINRRHGEGSTYLQRLQALGMGATLLASHTIRLDKPLAVDRLPGFGAGDVSVQDWGAQQAAPLLDVQPGMRVLDACAAPGGKTAHLAELVDCDLTAVDIDATRLVRVSDNLQRLGLHARVVTADALHMDCTLPENRFDRILADVPCSASGVVRRHPDIKWLRRESDLGAFTATQRLLVEALWRLLVPGGKLLYATCSVFPRENTLQIEAFLTRHPDARRLPLSGLAQGLHRGSESHPGQLLPDANTDGFFYALLEKRH